MPSWEEVAEWLDGHAEASAKSGVDSVIDRSVDFHWLAEMARIEGDPSLTDPDGPEPSTGRPHE